METRIIKAVFGASKSIVAPKRFKNDWGQVLELVGITLPQTFTAHFANSKTGMAKKRIGQNNQVDVPDEFFTSGADIYCWVMVHDTVSDGRTMYTVRIPIEDRADATDVEPTPVEQDVITQAIVALNSAVEKTAQDVESADASAQSAKADADRAETARDTAEGYVVDVQNYAQQAQASAASANQSAETASTKASEASTSAQTASTKATEASGYASTASQKATESSQSASTAVQAKTDAETAKTASETAQGLAESARDDAITAKTSAESARNEAQDIVDGITNKIEQIDSNTERIESLEDDRYKPYVTDSASGSVASFPDGADDVPMVDVLVNIDPVQDLHGYENPWPAGGGKNLLQNNNVSAVINGVTFTVHDDGTITVNGTASEDTDFDIKSGLSLEAGSYVLSGCPTGGSTSTYRIFATHAGSDTGSSLAFAFNATTATTVRINIKSGTTISNLLFKPMICLSSAQNPTAFAPYENICPISGWNGVNVSHSGADISDATVYSITFPVEAGTVYGGTLDVTTGVLTVDRAMVEYDGSSDEQWGEYGNDSDHYCCIAYPSGKALGYQKSICNEFKNQNSAYGSSDYGICSDHPNYTNTYFRMPNAEVTTKAEFLAWIAENPIHLCYEVAEPITYTLTPQEITSLLGTNNLWADTGDSSVEYRADTKLYIQKKITEAVSALS